jgi:hypothetical protein
MKKSLMLFFRLFVAVTVVLLAVISGQLNAGEYLKGALHYSPPPILYEAGWHSDPGDDPLSGDGPGTEFLAKSDRDFGSITFQFSLIGFTVGNGKWITYVPVDTNQLRRIFAQSLAKAFTEEPPIWWTNVGRLPAVAANPRIANQEPRFRQNIWVQVETNWVLKIHVLAQSRTLFDVLRESIKTVRIDSNNYFKSLRPKAPNIITAAVSKIELGFAPRHGRDVTAFVLHSKTGIWSLVSGIHFDQDTENQIFRSLESVLLRLSEQSAAGIRCCTTVDLSHYDYGGTDQIQRTLAFHVAEQRHPLRGLNRQKLEGGQPVGLDIVARNGPPAGFRKVRELIFPMELVIEEHWDQ